MRRARRGVVHTISEDYYSKLISTMFEARLVQGSLFKKVIEAIRELVVDANLECTDTGITMQAMDSSHVSLCALSIKSEGFDHFRYLTRILIFFLIFAFFLFLIFILK